MLGFFDVCRYASTIELNIAPKFGNMIFDINSGYVRTSLRVYFTVLTILIGYVATLAVFFEPD